jgi:predicted DNA binding CopG/RHH family protein
MLFKKEKEEKKTITEKYDNMSKNLDALAEGEKAEKELKKENEELQEKVHNSNNIDSFDACNKLLQK